MATSYCWVITIDYEKSNWSDGRLTKEIIGPEGCHLQGEDIYYHDNAQCFRLRNQDKEVVCLGYFLDIDGKATRLEPLVEYGSTRECTSIQYRNLTGEWNSI